MNEDRRKARSRHGRISRHFHFLFHLTPSFVFSTTMPAEASSARIASDLEKLRPRRATSISTMFPVYREFLFLPGLTLLLPSFTASLSPALSLFPTQIHML